MQSLNKQFGVNPRIVLEQIDDNHIGIIKLIKSRIIRKDALKIIEIANHILDQDPTKKVSLICTSNICSKSIELLNKNDIQIIIK